MCPSTEHTDEQRAFAADVLRKLLQHIVNQNQFANAAEGHYTFLVSHAWTEGPMMYLVYQAPPSDISWGLVRDTRESILDPSPWPDVDEAVLYYYLLDLEENWPGHFSRQPGKPTRSAGEAIDTQAFQNTHQTSTMSIATRRRHRRWRSTAQSKRIRWSTNRACTPTHRDRSGHRATSVSHLREPAPPHLSVIASTLVTWHLPRNIR